MMSAQTALRESIGRHELAQMITDREMMGRELQRILDEKTNPWGITVQSVEIRDVKIPQALEDAMSREAQAERERRARVILGTAETEISGKFADASALYKDNPIALHLRAMNMLYEGLKEKGALMLVPSSAVESMGMGGLLGAAALNQQKLTSSRPGGATTRAGTESNGRTRPRTSCGCAARSCPSRPLRASAPSASGSSSGARSRSGPSARSPAARRCRW